MTFPRYAGLIILMLALSCGSKGEKSGPMEERKESESIQAITLKYKIDVSNIPLMGPQTEEVELAVSMDAVRYEGSVEVMVGDEVSKIQRSSILNFSDTSQAFLNSSDSTYSVDFYALPGVAQSSPKDHNSGYVIELAATNVTKNIGQLNQCHKFEISSKGKSSFTKSDSISLLKGEIWLYGGNDVREIIQNYYGMQAEFMGDSSFQGMELWGGARKAGDSERRAYWPVRSIKWAGGQC